MLHHQGMPSQRVSSQRKPSQHFNLYLHATVILPVIIITTMLGSCYAQDPVLVSAPKLSVQLFSNYHHVYHHEISWFVPQPQQRPWSAFSIQIDMQDLPDGKHKKMEKYILRKAFDDPSDPYLPESVLWRQKEQFSDGVGYSWVDGLKEYAQQVSGCSLTAAILCIHT